MICWECYWGWPKPVAEIYKKALADLDGDYGPLHFGPAHVVWEDENFGLADSCIADFEQWKGDYSDKELDIVMRSLRELALLPQSAWDIVPPDYDGEHPELYPPTVDVEHCAYGRQERDFDL